MNVNETGRKTQLDWASEAGKENAEQKFRQCKRQKDRACEYTAEKGYQFLILEVTGIYAPTLITINAS